MTIGNFWYQFLEYFENYLLNNPKEAFELMYTEILQDFLKFDIKPEYRNLIEQELINRGNEQISR